MRFYEVNQYKGKLEIWMKGTSDPFLIWTEDNIVVSGMGTGLSYLFVGDGSNNVLDFLPKYFQLGVSGSTGLQVSSTSELGSNLTLKEYGSDLFIKLKQFVNGYFREGRVFGKIINNNVKIVDDSTIEYQIVVDKYTANNIVRDNRKLPLNEIGLFMGNPFGDKEDTPILIAYRYFDPILKSENFSLIFKWAITKL